MYTLENNVPQPGSPRSALASSTLTDEENRLVSFNSSAGYTLTNNLWSPVHGLVLEGAASASYATIRPWIPGDVYSVRVSAAVTAGDDLCIDTTNTGELVPADATNEGPVIARALATVSTAGNVLAIAVSNNGAYLAGQPDPVAINATATIGNTDLVPDVIITSTTASAVTATTPTATNLKAQLPHLSIGQSFDVNVIVTGATNAFTLAGGTGVTIVGAAAVSASTSATFRFKRTADTTFVVYRIG